MLRIIPFSKIPGQFGEKQFNSLHRSTSLGTFQQGNRFDSKVDSFNLNYPKIDIFKQDWNSIVNRLRHAQLLITGRHHEAYAALKARCKFIVLPGNTHKNEGIYLNAGVSPINSLDDIQDVLEGQYDREFNKIFDYYENRKRIDDSKNYNTICV